MVDGPARDVMGDSQVFSSQINKLFRDPRYLVVGDVLAALGNRPAQRAGRGVRWNGRTRTEVRVRRDRRHGQPDRPGRRSSTRSFCPAVPSTGMMAHANDAPLLLCC